MKNLQTRQHCLLLTWGFSCVCRLGGQLDDTGSQPFQKSIKFDEATSMNIKYRTRAIITRGLYTFYQLFEVQKRFLRGFLLNSQALCMVSIQEGF